MSFSSLNTNKQELNFFRKTLKQSKKFLLNLKIDSNISIINCISKFNNMTELIKIKRRLYLNDAEGYT